MSGIENDVFVGKNVNFNFTAAPPHTGIVTANGQLLIGSTTDPNIQIVANTLTAGSGISIANGPGSITISNTGSMTDLHTARFIVSAGGTADGANYTTIALALAAAGAGPATIFLQPGTFTENFTLPANINLAAYNCDAETPNVSIVGKITCTDAGSRSISGIRLTTNSDNFLTISGSANTIVNLIQCYLNCTNNTGISLSSSGASSGLNIYYCSGNLATTGIALFAKTNSSLTIKYSNFTNTGGSSTASTNSAGDYVANYCTFRHPFACSSTGNFSFEYCQFPLLTTGGVCITSAGNATCTIYQCQLSTNTVACVSVGAGTEVFIEDTIMQTDGTDVVDGAGTVNYSSIINRNTGLPSISTTTQTGRYNELGKYHAKLQPAFSAYQASAEADETGDGTNFILGDTDVSVSLTEVFDQDSNFTTGSATGATFTAPINGKYQLNTMVLLQQVAATNTVTIIINTSNRIYTFGNWGTAVTGNMPIQGSVLADMDAGDTATVVVNAGNGTKTVDIYGAGDYRTGFSGFLAC